MVFWVCGFVPSDIFMVSGFFAMVGFLPSFWPLDLSLVPSPLANQSSIELEHRFGFIGWGGKESSCNKSNQISNPKSQIIRVSYH